VIGKIPRQGTVVEKKNHIAETPLLEFHPIAFNSGWMSDARGFVTVMYSL
jgi:hypothetical protein